jgi:hypothetical protein
MRSTLTAGLFGVSLLVLALPADGDNGHRPVCHEHH